MAYSRGYKKECPVCHKGNFWVTEDNGMRYCFNCKYVEHDHNVNYQPPAPSEHIDEIRGLYTQAAYYYHSSLDTKGRDFLHDRGFTDQTIDTLQIGYCPTGMNPMYRSAIAKEAGLATQAHTAFLGDRITFPYFCDHTTVTDIRARAMSPNADLIYKSPYNGSTFRGAIYPYNHHLTDTDQPIILTEGEIKADIAVQFNYPAIALPGINAWRKGIRLDRTYIILFDSQREHIKEVRNAITHVASQLTNPLVATLPLLGDQKQDIDGFILKYGISLFNAVVDAALPYETWRELQR